jgi:hypothetical protein
MISTVGAVVELEGRASAAVIVRTSAFVGRRKAVYPPTPHDIMGSTSGPT